MNTVDVALFTGAVGIAAYLFREELGLVPATSLVQQQGDFNAAPSTAPAWRAVDEVKQYVELLEGRKKTCGGRRIQRNRCIKKLDKEIRKVVRKGTGGGFAQGAAAFGSMIGDIGAGVGAAYGGAVGGGL